jgi:nucleotide-binding universal stress UspA family protein
MLNLASLQGESTRFILHPTDFSHTSDLAFAHALRLAVHDRAAFSLLHVLGSKQDQPPWDEYPEIRETLERWGFLAPGAQRSDVADKLGMRVQKVLGIDKNVTDYITKYVREHAVDMVVLATGEHDILPHWFRPSIAESVAMKGKVPTLFIPFGARGCVSLEDGSVRLENILIPVDRKPCADLAIERAVDALAAFGSDQSKLTLLHVGDEPHFPWPRWPDDFRWQHVQTIRQGRVVDEILRSAEELTADLIVLVTAGAHGILDALRGSTTQQIVRHAPCPVLAIPYDF